MEIENWLLE